MEDNKMKYVIINKNRGWRGLAEIRLLNEDHNVIATHIFSFSQPVWEDLIFNHQIVVASDNNYYILTLDDEDPSRLPGKTQQRSVLIKNYFANITNVSKYSKDNVWETAKGDDWTRLIHFTKNKNNHTTSDWNCIGVRVIPEI